MASKWRLNKSEEKEARDFAEAEAAKASADGGDKSEAYNSALAMKTKELKEAKAAKSASKKGAAASTAPARATTPSATESLKSPGWRPLFSYRNFNV